MNISERLTPGQRRALKVLVEAGHPMTLNEVSLKSTLKVSTLRNYLTTFRSMGLVDIDNTVTPNRVTLAPASLLEPSTVANSWPASNLGASDPAVENSLKRTPVQRDDSHANELMTDGHLLCARYECRACSGLKEHLIDQTMLAIVQAADWAHDHEFAERIDTFFSRWIAEGRRSLWT